MKSTELSSVCRELLELLSDAPGSRLSLKVTLEIEPTEPVEDDGEDDEEDDEEFDAANGRL